LRDQGEDNFGMNVNGGSVTITIRSASSGWCVKASYSRKYLLLSMMRHLHQISSRYNTCVKGLRIQTYVIVHLEF